MTVPIDAMVGSDGTSQQSLNIRLDGLSGLCSTLTFYICDAAGTNMFEPLATDSYSLSANGKELVSPVSAAVSILDTLDAFDTSTVGGQSEDGNGNINLMTFSLAPKARGSAMGGIPFRMLNDPRLQIQTSARTNTARTLYIVSEIRSLYSVDTAGGHGRCRIRRNDDA